MTNAWTGGQYSVYRILLGLWLLVWLLPLSSAGLSGVGLAWAILGAVACVPLILGWHDRVAAGVVILAQLGAGMTSGLGLHAVFPAMLFAVGLALPLLHAMTPPAPFWSVAAIGRDNPGNDWTRPPLNYTVTWSALSAICFVGAILLLRDPAWRNGMPAALDGWPTGLAQALAYALLASWLALAPLSPVKTYRHWVWLVSLIVNVIALSVMGWPMLAAGMVVFHLAAFDPAWLARADPDEPEPLFYDGYCGLCHRWVRFVLAEDADGKAFVLSPLQGDLIKQRLTAEQRENLPDSIVVLRDDDAVLTKSSAILHILDRLGGLWRIGSWIGRAIPGVVRDTAYDGIASVRHRLFKKPSEACPMMPEPLRGRFQF